MPSTPMPDDVTKGKTPATPAAPPPKRKEYGVLGLVKVRGGGTIDDLIARKVADLKSETR